jgi:hypothetical protein
MAKAYLKNSMRSGPNYRVDLREVLAPDYRTDPKGAFTLKLDFHAPKDIVEYPEIPAQNGSVSQVFLTFDGLDFQDLMRYLQSKGAFQSAWFDALQRGENV